MGPSLLPYLGAFLVGLSKAGLATGLGMLTTPLVATAMPARTAIGLILPLLCLADVLTMGFYWKQWDWKAIRNLQIGGVIGIGIGMLFVSRVSNNALSLAIGIVGLIMAVLLVVRERWYPDHVYRPSLIDGMLVGAAAGFSSAIAHAAGPIVAIYLLAQRMSKEAFVASNAIFFTVNNLIKVPPYLAAGLITTETLRHDLRYLPMLPLGVAAGWAINRLLPQRYFDVIVQVMLFITSRTSHRDVMAELTRQQLDPRSVTAGRLGGWTFTLAMLLVAGGSGVAALIGTGAPLVSWIGSGAVALLIFGVLAAASHFGPAVRYRSTWVRLDEDGLEYEHGWLWRHHISVPRSRIQHTDVTQGPYERRFGLATLVVYTAGTENASIAIEGLSHETALAFRDALLARGDATSEAPAGGGDAI